MTETLTTSAASAPPARTPRPLTAVSVIVPVTERPHDLAWLYRTFSAELVAAKRPYEFVFVLEPWARSFAAVLEPLVVAGEPIRVLEVGQSVGEASLLDAAASTCSSPIIATQKAWLQPAVIATEPGGTVPP